MKAGIVAAVSAMAVVMLASCGTDTKPAAAAASEGGIVTNGYTLVVLKNNSVMIGKLSRIDTATPVLQDVFLLRPPVRDEKTQEVSKPAVIRRKSEMHNPERTYLMRDSILYFEPIDENSVLAQLMRQQTK